MRTVLKERGVDVNGLVSEGLREILSEHEVRGGLAKMEFKDDTLKLFLSRS